MAEDEVVRDLKKKLTETDGGLGPPTLTRSSSSPTAQGELLFPDVGRARDIAQPGGFRREHLLRQGAGFAAAQQSLLSSLLDPRMQKYFSLEQETLEAASPGHSPGASNLSTVLVILKSTIGGTLIIIPGAFSKTGLLVAPLLLLLVGGIEIYCMVLLVTCVRRIGGSYGEIARRSMGSLGLWAVDVSILLSQIGFVCAEMLYVAKNCNKALTALGIYSSWASETSILLLQLLVVIPMSWIRKLQYFQVSNIIANATVLLALAFLLGYSFSGLMTHGPGVGIESSGPHWMIFAGTVVFSFECINFVIPMYDAHEQKETFAPILVFTLLGVCALFIVFGGVNYAYYGKDTNLVITSNLPEGSQVGRVIPFAFALGSLFNVPLCLFPAAIYVEALCFSNVPKSRNRTWKINRMRTVLILSCAFVAFLGKNQIDAFIALIGSVCCVPLAFIFPVICHAKICHPNWQTLAVNVAVLLLGVILFFYTSASALQQLAALD
ncbi:Vacuolar amino acid transporter 3 [Durusdinium trenchii]|uniref:Vacuolar amino acid transporter 3 n=1 Tax=Durusdinium trenchii TaxID=1381693 RepID=A0ABP0PEF5_9DINO